MLSISMVKNQILTIFYFQINSQLQQNIILYPNFQNMTEQRSATQKPSFHQNYSQNTFQNNSKKPSQLTKFEAEQERQKSIKTATKIQSVQEEEEKLQQKQTQMTKPEKISQQKISFSRCGLFCLIVGLFIISLIISSGLNVGVYYLLQKGNLHRQIQPNQLQNKQLQSAKLTATTTDSSSTQIFPQCDDKWVYFEQKKQVFQFGFNNINENVFSFSSVISKDLKVKFIKLLIYHHMGHSGIKNSFLYSIKTRVINNNKQWVHWSEGIRYSQDAYSFNSEQVIVPCWDTREIRFKSSHIQNNAFLSYEITGYLPA